jgi:hypothetical protein
MSRGTNYCTTESGWNRRRFLLRLSWAGLSLYLATFLAAVLRFIWPRVSSRPAMSVQVGFPDDYGLGEVVYHRGKKLFVVRDEEGFLHPPELYGSLEQGSPHVFMPLPRREVRY